MKGSRWCHLNIKIMLSWRHWKKADTRKTLSPPCTCLRVGYKCIKVSPHQEGQKLITETTYLLNFHAFRIFLNMLLFLSLNFVVVWEYTLQWFGSSRFAEAWRDCLGFNSECAHVYLKRMHSLKLLSVVINNFLLVKVVGSVQILYIFTNMSLCSITYWEC
jgi:hypothetical protein